MKITLNSEGELYYFIYHPHVIHYHFILRETYIVIRSILEKNKQTTQYTIQYAVRLTTYILCLKKKHKIHYKPI